MKIVRDFSHWNIIYDYPIVRANADAFIIKAYDIEYTQNPDDEDPAHDDHWFGLRPKPVAEYLYFDPGANPRDQVLGYLNVSYRGFLDALDFEETEGIDAGTVTNRVIGALENFILEAGRKAWLYSNINLLDNVLREPARIATLIGGIWLAWPSPNSNQPRLPANYPPELVKLWQKSWTEEIDGTDGPTDYSVWMGTDAEWDDLMVMPPIPDPPTSSLEPRLAVVEQKVQRLEDWGTSLET